MRAERHVRATVPPLEDSEESLYRRAARLLGLSTPIHSEVDLVDRLEKGLSPTVIRALRAGLGLTDEEVYALIAPRRTLNRREADGQPLSSEEGDRAVRIARIGARAQQVFAGKPEYAQEWLRTPLRALGDRSPFQALSSESGARAVEEILLGIEHGFFA